MVKKQKEIQECVVKVKKTFKKMTKVPKKRISVNVESPDMKS